MMNLRKILLTAAASVAGASMMVSAPAFADVKAGVDAWGAGDYTKAVAEWRGPAEAGDADAQFNMAQAYRLGRGVEEDPRQAEVFYSRAAAQGHIKAADNYGLLLFQDGRREQAMPYVQAASDRGDPRAQYLLGIAHFNGDLVEKDWVRAYALLTMANSAGLPQAAPAISQMDSFIPLDQRQRAQTLAVTMKREADARRISQMAAADLGSASGGAGNGSPVRAVTAPPRVAAPVARPPVVAARTSEIPRPIPTTTVAPSVTAARAAVAEAARVTGTSSPAQAGADFARPGTAPAPVRAATPPPARAAVTPAPAPRAAAPAPGSGKRGWPVARPARGIFGARQCRPFVDTPFGHRRFVGQAQVPGARWPPYQAAGRRFRQPQ